MSININPSDHSPTSFSEFAKQILNKQCLNLTLITSIKPLTLTKTFALNSDDKLEKMTAANLIEGQAETILLDNLADFPELLVELNKNQALCYGVTGHDKIKLTTKEQIVTKGNPHGYLARTNESFHWKGQGILMLDYDPRDGYEPFSRNDLLEKIHTAAPLVAHAASVSWVSASSCIYNTATGSELTGIRGQRIYFHVADATDIPRAGKVLFDRLWLTNSGWYEVSKAGYLLERSIIDANVWQTNRLDFAAGAHCIEPLTQNRGKPQYIEGVILDTRKALPDLTSEEQEQLSQIRSQLKNNIKTLADQAKADFIQEKVLAIAADSSDESLSKAHSTVRRAIENNVLMGDFPLTLDDGKTLTVSELLNDPIKYHGRLTLDPIEPEYLDQKVVGKLYLIGGRHNIHSFAHGGRNFKLMRQPRRIELVRGKMHDTVNQVIELMREMPDIFDIGQQIVTVNKGRAFPLDEYRLAHWLGGVIQMSHWKQTPRGKYEVLDDPPPKMVKAIIALGQERNLKRLDAVITAPVITAENFILDTPGYCIKTRLCLDTSETTWDIPSNVNENMVREAVCFLMEPFETFPFCTNLDKAVFLSGLITAVLRPILPTALSYAFDAPVQGSGKTLLASCLAVLATGEKANIWPHIAGRDDEEIRKRIFTALRSGERALIWDNIIGIFDSPAIAALLTSENYTDRQLGKSEASTIPNRSLFLMTGNNIMLAGDLPRRVLKCRIDPKSERPYARRFNLDPLSFTITNRQKMVVEALIIVRGWLQSHEYKSGIKADGRMASFEIWDDLVRQPVAWINRIVIPGNYGDVMDAVDASQRNDPRLKALGELLAELKRVFGNNAFTAHDIYLKIQIEKVLADCFCDLVNNRNPSARTIGRVLANRIDRIVNNLVLQERPKTNVLHWLVVACAD